MLLSASDIAAEPQGPRAELAAGAPSQELALGCCKRPWQGWRPRLSPWGHSLGAQAQELLEKWLGEWAQILSRQTLAQDDSLMIAPDKPRQSTGEVLPAALALQPGF